MRSRRRIGWLLAFGVLALAAAGFAIAPLRALLLRAASTAELLQASQQHPDDALLARVAGRRLLSENRAAEARDLLIQAAADHSRDARLQALAGRAALAAGDVEGAGKILQAAVEADPENAEVRFLLGEFLSARGYAGSATKLWEDTVRLDPGYGAAWWRLGERNLAAQRYPLALEQLDRAEQFTPTAEVARLRASTLKSLGRLPEARRAAEAAVAREPNAASVVLLAEIIQLTPGMEPLKEAQSYLVRAVALDPSADNLRLLAVNYRSAGDHLQAVRALRRLLRVTPASSEAYLLLSQSYQALGKPALAAAALRIYRRIEPLERRVRRADYRVSIAHGALPAQLDLARVYIDVGRQDLARNVLERARRRFPDSTEIAALARRAQGPPTFRVEPLPPDTDGDSS
jgi:tetratricopeptide (TPR) repeat protein